MTLLVNVLTNIQVQLYVCVCMPCDRVCEDLWVCLCEWISPGFGPPAAVTNYETCCLL